MWESVADLSAMSAFVNLERLMVFGSKVSDLSPLTALPKLAVLGVTDSLVSDLTPLSQMKGLMQLELNGNQITDLTPLKSLTQLECLNVSHNRITDLSPLYGLDSLNVLYISHNLTTDASGFKDIANKLKDKDFDPGKPMETAERQGTNDGKSGKQGQQSSLPLDTAKVVKFADKVMEKKVREAIGKPEGNITAGDAAAVENLNLGNEWQDKFPKGSQISNLGGIEYFINLKSLDISWNKIKDIKKLAVLTKLECLRAYGNQISNIAPLAGLINMNNLNIGGNKVSKIDALKNLVNLTSLYLDGNPIKDFSPIEAIYPQLAEKDFALK
jgi:internalin A